MSAPVLLLAGPTASGKTTLALELAERFDAEVVSADSRQIYRGMEIGTAAPSAAARARVRHHLVGTLDPYERYSAARFVADALRAIDDIVARGKNVLVVGGTGFYLRALAGDVALCDAYDETLRARLAREALVHPPDVLHAWLAARVPERASELQPNDRYRVVRALEIALALPGRDGPARTDCEADGGSGRATLASRGIPSVKIVLEVEPGELDGRIARRVEAMLTDGLLDEADRIGAQAAAADAVGYPQALAYLAGHSTRSELRAALVRATRRYAKRQKTWFRSEPGVRFAAASEVPLLARDLFERRMHAAST